ncbi:MAG: tetratricopeptide repeat protein [Brevinema sp.]
MKKSYPIMIVIFLLGLFFGFIVGRSVDPIDLVLRKAEKINKNNSLSGSLRLGGAWNLFGMFSSYQTISDEIKNNPQKQKAFFENITNQISQKKQSIDLLNTTKTFIKLAKQEVLIDHSLHRYLYTLGLLELQNGMFFAAVTDLEQAYFLLPSDIKTKQSLATAYIALYRTKTSISEKKDISQKIIHYSLLALEDNPRHLDTLYGLGLVYLDLREFDSALDYFEQILIYSPENINALLGIARVYFEQNDLLRSKNIYEQTEALILEKLGQKKFLRKSLNHEFELNQRLNSIRNNLNIIYELLEE